MEYCDSGFEAGRQGAADGGEARGTLSEKGVAMKEFKFTLYEVFGYLFPGYAALFAILYLFSTFFNPSQEVALSVLDNSKIFIAFSVLAYVSGHMVQALANYFYWFLSPEKVIDSEIYDSKGSFNFELIREAEIRIKKLLNIGNEKTISLSNLNQFVMTISFKMGIITSEKYMYIVKGSIEEYQYLF